MFVCNSTKQEVKDYLEQVKKEAHNLSKENQQLLISLLSEFRLIKRQEEEESSKNESDKLEKLLWEKT